MQKKLLFIIILALFLSTKVYSKSAEKEGVDIEKLSEAVGHMIGKNLEDLGCELDIKKIIKGIKNKSLKKSSPMSQDECNQALAKLQEMINSKKSKKNLEVAQSFLKNNKKKSDIIELEENKLQYKVLKKGTGDKVENYNFPIVKIKGKYLDDKVFTDVEEMINLNETLPSLKKAIVGMQKNEKRIVYVHPELSFGKSPPFFNSLAIFEIEVLNLDTNQGTLKEIAKQDKVLR